MRNLFINILATALMVCVATVASVSFGAVLVLFAATPGQSTPSDPGAIMFAGMAGAAMAAVAGVFFCVATLFVAAVSMPPTLWLVRKTDLPRPAMDVIGGGCAGLFCALAGVDAFDHDKFAGMITPEGGQILATVGLVAGCVLGLVRHALLVRPHTALTASPASA